MRTCVVLLALLLTSAALAAEPVPLAAEPVDNTEPSPRLPTDGWGAPFQLTNNSSAQYTGYSFQNPIAVDPSGNVHTIWYDTRTTWYSIYYRKWTRSTGTWSPETRLAFAESASYYRGGIACDNSGNVHVTWYSTSAGRYGVYYKKYNAGTGTWSSDTLLFSPGGNNFNLFPSIACRPGGGNVHIVWYGLGTGGITYYRVWHIEYTPGSGWSTVTQVSTDNASDAQEAGVAVDPSDNAYVIWRQRTPTSAYYKVFYRARIGGTWAALEQASPATFDNVYCYNPDIEVTGTGDAHVVWYSDPPGGAVYGIFYRPRSSGTWGSVDTVSRGLSGAYSQYYPGIALAGDTVHVCWRGYAPASPLYYQLLYRRRVGGVWDGSYSQLTNRSTGTVYYSGMTTDAYGCTHICWYDSYSGNNDPWYIRRAPDVANDVGIDAILAPAPDVGSRNFPIVPRARVKNFGLLTQTGFAVRCTILGSGGGVRYTGSYTIPSLNPGDTVTVSFGSWTPAALETVRVRFRTTLAGEQNPENDTLARPSVLQRSYYTGGPDVAWRYWIDSDTAGGPAYNWCDISVGGSDVSFSSYDDDAVQVQMGMPFNFYGTTYSQVYVCTNGFLSFGSPYTTLTNSAIPNPGSPNNAIYPFWDDLNCVGPGHVKFRLLGSTPNETLVVSWNRVRFFGSTDTSLSFQVLLFEGSNEVRFQYADVEAGRPSGDFGFSATVGVENGFGTSGLQYLYGNGTQATPYGNLLASGRAVRFYRSQPTNNIALDAIVNPTRFFANTSIYPAVRIRNDGTASQASIQVRVRLDSAGTQVYNRAAAYSGTLNSGDTATVTFTTPARIGAKGVSYSLTAISELPSDEWRHDDTMVSAGVAVGAPNRYFQYQWSFGTGNSYASGVTPVQDTLIWVSSGGILGTGEPNYIYVFDARTFALLDSFLQPAAVSSAQGIRDMTWDPAANRVYGGLESNTMYAINATTHVCVDTSLLTGPNLPGTVRALAFDGDSLYSANLGSAPVVKFARDGSNCHQVAPVPAGNGACGLACDRSHGRVYLTQSASVPNALRQYDLPSWTRVQDTLLAYVMGTQGGCELWRSDTFLLTLIEGSGAGGEDSVVCYRVIPIQRDYGVSSIGAPTGVVEPDSFVTPAATWHNYHALATGPFTAWLFLASPTRGRIYSQTRTIDGLAPGRDTLLRFTAFNVGPDTGTWTVRCSTYIDGDANPANDARDGSFLVRSVPPTVHFWEEKAPMPAPPSGKDVKDGGWLAESDNLIYAAKGNKTSDFYSYSPVGDSWHQLAPIPTGTEAKPPYKGACGVVGGDYVYMVKGNNTRGFYRYDIVGDSWHQLADVPLGPSNKKVKGGSDVVYVHGNRDTGFVYLLKGYKNEFFRYHTALDSWQQMPDAPPGARPKYDKGSWLAVHREPQQGPYTIYCHKAKYHEFWKYDAGADSWNATALKGMPFLNRQGKSKKSKDGGCGTWLGDGIYALKGGNTQEFWKYWTEGDSWHELDTIPVFGSSGRKKKIKAGADIVGAMDVLFALKGNKCRELWRYLTWRPLPGTGRPSRSGVMALECPAGDFGFSIAPNPLRSGFAVVRLSQLVTRNSSLCVSIFDAAGRIVFHSSLVTRSSSFALDLRSMSAGVYLVRLDAGSYRATRKLVVQR